MYYYAPVPWAPIRIHAAHDRDEEGMAEGKPK